MKIHNFSAGPSILNEKVIENAAEAVRSFADTGLSLIEVSHRGKQFTAVIEECRKLFLELIEAPAGYDVVFLGGGASLQFYMAPLNFLKTKAAYIDTGTWASNAIKEAKLVGDVEVLASSKADTYTWYPELGKDYTVPSDVDYFHVTSNNTIYGTQLHKDLDVNVPLIADMSSDIFSRPVDVSKYDLIYGGAQKNLAPAGVTFAVVKLDALGKVDRPLPTMLNYKTHVDKESMFNTPPVFPIYVALQTLKWYKEMGGVKGMQKMCEEKAAVLYNAIDSSKIFRGTVRECDRSLMNVCFVMKDEYKELEAEFQKFATERGMSGIKGHRSVGGFRASLYNALPLESVKALVDAMKAFEAKI
ncbi:MULTISPECIES: 3-phosphoserine/phosphohydroxythreonine transaminase [Porphyromonas]|uniref:Phosphoserine aminotransferase n=1 Tax=Porphyromonas canoris TaxID=36875 RepID=A0ABR4XJF0_9PORP|nr:MULTISPECIES: 3-phosphoserine/phosphohydroxythreonine transaminase [Porphyromonas]KGL52850.1 MFS transporter [Porphyromonas canoris]KGN70312.1 MFS transporter [Porphyromonas sp. COT-108 OH1349]KGN91825.1 MFS transporter [Porphyromonas canoris]KGN95592.1 MFS transporter [Porphyromonas sp. COT-108 OH2963]